MTVILSAELTRLVKEKVQSGEFADADEVVSRALELLQSQHRGEQSPELLDEQPPNEGGRPTTANERARKVDEFFADIDRSLPPETPVLSPEATTREGIYGDFVERA
jgi:Arc/MetJ-type ribon-helix-helix transcriptional regulator